ncbi:endonuclease MutS2 [Carnobacterium maltaromaticum]|jgi:dsDNA-specific endonuclease/ATPase MutS2|uniref:MutS domain V family protein n=1 Tax=Carnobacterium maltaromaticum LMA28 TaxID=1234679 RepID=K8EI23_CARML|nr:mutS domain V family protein [Carnobacterium maltaromaticum]AOA02301.1 mannonate oxidoreductase [Carnobacterium maltaromaticum]KRN65630.1 muts2 family protein [Carnobacterium maltaromaticum DSM 20342]MCI1818868.1 endonuclease MutS2 [Carnobacterium maltaromaticum]CCO11473.2 mutS domain V family protein [Carnobacterium maltaromaticum LMA28]
MNLTTIEKIQFNQVKEQIERHCVSSLGKKRFKKLQLNAKPVVVTTRYNETEEARALLDAKLTMPFMGLSSIDVFMEQLEKGLLLEASSLIDVADFLRSGRMIRRFMEKYESLAPTLTMYARSISEFTEIEDEIYFSIKNGQVADEASKELRRIRRLIAEKESKIEERLSKFLKNKDNQKQIQEFFVSKKNERFTIPIKAAYKNQVAGTIIETSSKGTTVFIEPTAVTKLNDELAILKVEESTEIYQILATLSGLILENLVPIQLNLETIAEYDMIFARGKYSRLIQGVTPKLNQRGYIHLVNAVHPLIEANAVPLNFTVGEDYRGLIITGPNAGGKTVVLKTVGLLALMTLLGIQLPADEGTEMGLFEGIFVDIGDSQSLENALSTFSSHIQNIADIMQVAPRNSLVLFDEIGSGTEPNEGAALAIAILEEFYQRGNIVVATTHYGEIKRYSEIHPDFINAAMAFDQATLTPLYQLLMGESGESNALWIAKKMNLKEHVIQQAQRYMEDKDYSLTKASIPKNKTMIDSQTERAESVSLLKKGDRVLLLDYNENGLVFEDNPLRETVTVFYRNDYHEVVPKRLKLEVLATDLYPPDYDLSTLFTSYTERKLDHDINRGSKKALKKIHREIKQQDR